MRRLVLLGGLFVIAGALGGVAMEGCSSASCDQTETCAPDGSTDGATSDRVEPGDHAEPRDHSELKDRGEVDGSDESDGSEGDAGDAESDADSAPACTPGAAPSENGCITDASGVFVATVAEGGSDTTGTGTMAKPYATVSHAVGALGKAKAIYVCRGAYTDQITVSGALSLYGGLTCASKVWVYSGAPATVPVVTASTATFALEINGVSGPVDIQDMELDGADAAAGGTTIALWANTSTNVALHRVKIVGATGGQGAKGAGGVAAPNYTTSDAGVEGGVNAVGHTGGGGGQNSCVDGTMPQGGQGGPGGATTFGGGTNGGPTYTTPVPVGATGAGGAAGAVCVAFPGSFGQHGGAAGTSALNAGAWSLSGAVWVASVAEPGTNGGPGQGGGGGGGNTGGGGGGGGAGGCGGASGHGGTSGGASFALLSVNSTVTLDQCTTVGGVGGAGGNGGDGQAGQVPGTAGTGAGTLNSGCSGGQGGYGQGGGGGAGGSGGPSIAVAYVGTPPSDPGGKSTVTVGTTAAASAGGGGGSGGTMTNPDDGMSGAPGPKTTPMTTLALPTTT